MKTFRFFADSEQQQENENADSKQPELNRQTLQQFIFWLSGNVRPGPRQDHSPGIIIQTRLVCSQLDSITRRNQSNQGASDGSDADDGGGGDSNNDSDGGRLQ